MTAPRSSLAHLAPLCHEADDSLVRAAAAKAWHEYGIALFKPDWLRAWTDQQQVIILAEKMFGKRKGDENAD